MSLFNDLPKGSPFRIRRGGKPQIIDEKDWGSGKLVDEFSIAAIPSGNSELFVALGVADVEGPASFPACLVGRGAGEKVLPAPVGPVVMMFW